MRQHNLSRERALEKIAESDKSVQHHRSNDIIAKLARRAENALGRSEECHFAVLLAKIVMLECRAAKEAARVAVRDAKLACVRRRLRKHRLLRLLRW